ncbi:hypothetical protein [Rhizobium sp. GN54]|uniref:hypothetical protein n=1 Tax=Rhizobium sp. GN54 TaxID=2898150 RepID=UPI001E3CB507|nr:hypothetical protein [Rhizobium sp. GN54]MCD2184731.1 hypothetical protein [Rhizobium sp. GN54]
MGKGSGSDGAESYVQAPEDDGGKADQRPKTAAGRSELNAYHPEHDPGYYLGFSPVSIGGSGCV